jgi:hypothetical protein
VLLALIVPASSEAGTPVRLQVKSRSWIQGSGFDAEHFISLCHDAGVDLLPAAAALPDRATALVTYTEDKGPGFSMFGIPPPVGYGTTIAFRLTLLAPKTAKTMVTVTAAAETPAGLEKDAFHQGAVDAFLQAPAYRLSCDVIAAALGAESRLRSLLPWALVDRQALSLLDTLGFTPTSDAERAYLATARADFTTLRTLETSATEPLLLLLQNSASNRNGIGLFPASEPEHANVLRHAVALLATQHDDRIPDTLAVFLNDYNEYRDDHDPVVSAVLIDVLRALATVGEAFTLPLLEEWQVGDTTLAKEAQHAAERLRTRVAIE